MVGRLETSDSITHMDCQVTDPRKISQGGVDFIKKDVVLVQAKDALIAHIVER